MKFAYGSLVLLELVSTITFAQGNKPKRTRRGTTNNAVNYEEAKNHRLLPLRLLQGEGGQIFALWK
jgi:hypothetical protein